MQRFTIMERQAQQGSYRTNQGQQGWT
jgi:hypothetical protein